MALESDPIVKFFNIVNARNPPRRADRASGGTLPTRAFRYCEAVTTASSFGWYVFPPMNFSLHWDGRETFWTFDDAGSNWFPLRAAQYPGFQTAFDLAAPENVRGYSPPFLGALPEPGVIQIWSGLLARTRADWSLLIRPPPNLPSPAGYDVYEGMVETDRWFGPLFINIRLTKTDSLITFREDFPLFQVQPVHRSVYADSVLNSYVIGSGLESFSDVDWASYRRTVVEPHELARCPVGHDAVAVRLRRKRDAP